MGKNYMTSQKLKELDDFIIMLSTEKIIKENQKEKIEILKKIYNSNKNRHLYSSIFSVLTMIDQREHKNQNNKEFDLNNIKTNILSIYKCVVNEKNIDRNCKSSIIKLYDHISLDIARIEYMRDIDRKSEQAREELEKNKMETKINIETLLSESKKLKKNLEKQLEETKEIKENIKDYNKEIFGVMGVFLTIFSIISINFDAYKAVAELSLSKILLLFIGINLSLFLILNFMFGFIKDILISKNVSINENNNRFWYTFLGLAIIGTIIVINMRYVPETRIQKIEDLQLRIEKLEMKNKLKK